MKKKNVIFIFIALFGFFFNSFVLADDDEEREVIDLTSGHSSYTLRNYTNCTIDSAISSNVNVTNEDGYAVFLKLSDPVGTTTTAGQNKTYSVTCAPIFNQGTRVQFNLEMTLVSQEEADDDSKYLNYDVTILKSTLFPMYKSCQFSGANDRYIKIENQTNGVFVTILKTGITSEKVELDCVTTHGNNAKLHLKVSSNASTGSDGINGVGHEDKSNNSNQSNTSKDSNNYNWGDPDGDCTFIFGDFSEKGTFGNMLRRTLKFIQYLGPILVIILTILDLVKAVASSDKDALTKLLKKTGKRMIYAVLLFIFPMLLDYVLRWTNVYGTCPILK